MRHAGRVLAAVLLSGLAAPASAADRPADAIVKEIEAVKKPTSRDELLEVGPKKAALIGELLKSHPGDSRLKDLLPERWFVLALTGNPDEALREVDEVVGKTKDAAFKNACIGLKLNIALFKASEGGGSKEVLPALDAYLKTAPKGPQTAAMIYQASTVVEDKAKRDELEDRILKEYPNTRMPAMIKTARKQRAAIGRPFELSFADAIKGTTVSIKDLKGKVVVLDFWATWCGPCIAEMPTMKKLYAEYKDKGVEFIGVSLDTPKEEGGLDKLKKYVADNDISWPQYYQGNGWESDFSKGWGVSGIPCVFVVDQDGNLFTTDARGKLNKLIPELLARKGKPSAGAGGR